MSRGPGVVQRRMIEAIQGEPARRFTVGQLAEIAFPGEPIERKHAVSVRRALKNLSDLELRSYKACKSCTRGWRYLVRRDG
jgi:hypothetical protein